MTERLLSNKLLDDAMTNPEKFKHTAAIIVSGQIRWTAQNSHRKRGQCFLPC